MSIVLPEGRQGQSAHRLLEGHDHILATASKLWNLPEHRENEKTSEADGVAQALDSVARE